MKSKFTAAFVGIFAVALFIQYSAFAQKGQASITLSVDATDAPHMILHSHEAISVKPGLLTLFYPKWIPGEHAPSGPVIDVAGIHIMAQGKSLEWRRDLEEMYAIHCNVPEGVSQIDLSFDFILPPIAEGFSSGASSTAKLLVLSWNQVVMYPLSVRPDEIVVNASLKLQNGWKYASALTTLSESNGTIEFAPTTLNVLVDSPVLSGLYLKRVDLTPPSGVHHFLNIASDNEAALEISPAEVAEYKNLVVEANALFGDHHYNHYDFLYTLSDQVAHFGLEHHQSSDDRVGERTLIDDDYWRVRAGLLPHEFVHSWNGKYRRPAGLATGNFSTPMKDDLLWVYEGLTEYLGAILTGRSGLLNHEQFREDLALVAARMDDRPGRTWRPLQDANDEASLLYDSRADWDSWRRSVDFYDEGYLIWLEADVTIRELTNGKKSLDDFCKKFHGGPSTGPETKPYTFDNVVEAMNEIAPFDWKTFFNTRLQSLSPHAPLGGIEKSGWKLVFRDTMNEMQKSAETVRKTTDLRYSLGIILREDGTINDVIPGSPAAKAGISPGMKLVAVNEQQYSKDIIRDALKLGRHSSSPLELLTANGEFYHTYSVSYHGGEQYPYLERDLSKPDLLSEIIAPKGTDQTHRGSK
ncbi:MAG TPA: M61 family peptidase [Bacteroidota bacterium]|nr:M61 family peptidase [Bacteroidota bacterium]